MAESRTLDRLDFSNRFTSVLPVDPIPAADANGRVLPREVLAACSSRVAPTPVAGPRLLAHSREVAEMLELDPATIESDRFAAVFGGNEVLPTMDPFAACYGGHQFGNWAGQLGDGRAIALGEIRTTSGQHFTLQLKGAGPTPYSRRADGRAVLRSSVREFLCSEAMYHLGVPTTRALSLVGTGDHVMRDMFYDGNPANEHGAIVCRVAPSFVRFGNFEIFSARNDIDTLRALADFTIRNNFAGLVPASGVIDADVYTAWFAEVADRTAAMIVDWMRVGFVHGVMNTDNLSILGLTIDYGPYGWLEDFDPGWTPNTTDASQKRYRYGNQPQVAHWNLLQLANAIYPLVGEADPLEAALNGFAENYEARSNAMYAAKLGLGAIDGDDDAALINDLFALLQRAETDMTLFFRHLADVPSGESSTDEELRAPLHEAYYVPSQLDVDLITDTVGWLRRYTDRVRRDGTTDADRRAAMNAVNPKYVLRNYLAQLAIDDADRGDPALISELLDVLRRPYDEQPGRERFAEKRPDWARTRPGCSMLSCSS